MPLCIGEHLTTLHPQHAVSHLPNLRRMADKDNLVETTDIHGVAKHAHVFSGILRVQGSDRLVAKEGSCRIPSPWRTL